MKKLFFILISVGLAAAIFFTLSRRPKQPKVFIKQYKNGDYALVVQGEPYVVKGVCYNPVPIGKSHDHDWWSDPHKPWLLDGKLMKDMGVNTVRVYSAGEDPEAVKRVINDLYELFGIRTIIGHWLGFWEYPCPLYGDKDFQERVKKEVLEMVWTYKDEAGILFWTLGNENNYSCLGRVNPWSTEKIDKEPDPQKRIKMREKLYYSFINDLAEEIHQIDPDHPVAMGNGELIGLVTAAEVCPDIDLVACLIYRGKTFGNLFKSLKATYDRPIVLTEFGADCYDAQLKEENQEMQAFFLESQWRQIYDNLAGNEEGAGNCLGGAMFEWTDEWWKHAEWDAQGWSVHDTVSNWSNGSYYFDILADKNMNMNEEWFGIVALSDKEKEAGLDKRLPRAAYQVIKEFWQNPRDKSQIKPPKKRKAASEKRIRGQKMQ
ncbi:hypothetical protein ACFLZ3_03080 [Candidatus Omnitrophota bacterium]